MTFPQLRVRTGMSYRKAYGKMAQVVDRLVELESGVAAIVDNNTWGHVRFEKECAKKGIKPIFGMEIPIITHDAGNGEGSPFRPLAWILAVDLRKFYAATSYATQNGGMTPEEFGALTGVVRFPGGALSVLKPAHYDYIDINPSSLLLANEAVWRHHKYGKPLLLTSYNDMPSEEDAGHAYAWEVRDSVGIRSLEMPRPMYNDALEWVATGQEIDSAFNNAVELANTLGGQVLNKAPLIRMEGDLMKECRAGAASRLERGHITEWSDEYEARLIEEVRQIELKEFQAYFFVVADLVRFAKKHMLVGPARGSAAGSLVCYVLGITEVDPIPYGLLFARFIDISRSDFPDIDIDFADSKRYMVFDYLREKYGADSVCKLGNISTLQAASVLAQVGKKFNISQFETDPLKTAIISYAAGDKRYGHSLEDTFAQTEQGDAFEHKHRAASDCMAALELHPSHSSVHAAGILVCNDPITHYCTVTAEGVAQLDKPDAEYLNLLKIDALGLRTLGIIDDAGMTTAEELYALRMDDPKVLKVLDDDRVGGIFQFEGASVRSLTNMVTIDSFEKIDNLTALARPGPLSSGMASKYADRASGKKPVEYDHPLMEPFLKDTYGIIIYQEQVMQIVKELGSLDWAKTSLIRKAISGSKGSEVIDALSGEFFEGAVAKGMPLPIVKKIWGDILTFGAYGFNKSHSVAYGIVTYWTLWAKCYHPLKFAAACLRSAKDDNQVISILREFAKEGIAYTPIDVEFSELNWTVADGRLIGGIMNAKGFGPITAQKYIEARDTGRLTDAQRNKLANAEIKYADLQEAHTRYGHFYDNPRLIGVTSGSKIVGMKTTRDGSENIIIAKLVKKSVEDENSAERVKRRDGKKKDGPTQMLDMMMSDDSADSPMKFRIRPENFAKMGADILENCPKGSWFLIKAKKLNGFEMFIVKNIKRID